MVQGAALLLWLPWLPSFAHQARVVYADFWIDPLSPYFVWLTFHNFNLAFPDGWFPGSPWWDLLFWSLAVAGVYALRRCPPVAFLLAVLFLGPALVEIAISLARPVLYDRTLIWTTLPYYLLIGNGLDWLAGATHAPRVRPRGRGRTAVALSAAAALLIVSGMSLRSYFVDFTKEDWPAAVAYVAEHAGPEDLLLFNAAWAEIPFSYYATDPSALPRRYGLPVQKFERGELESRMEPADLARLRALAADHDDVWLVYAHEWYTDPDNLIPGKLGSTHRFAGEQSFHGPRVLHFTRPVDAD